MLSAHPCATQDVPTASFSASVQLTRSSPTLQVPCSPVHSSFLTNPFLCCSGKVRLLLSKNCNDNPDCLHLNSSPNPTASTNTPISSPELVPSSCSFQSLLSRFHSCQDRKQRNQEALRGHGRSGKAGNVWNCLCCTQCCMAQPAMTGREG